MNCKELIEKRKKLWELTGSIERDTEYINAVATEILSNKDLYKEIVDNPEHLIELTFTIVNKDRKTVPFILNDIQKEFLNDLNQAQEDYRTGKRNSMKFLVLKGRQAGFTSFITAYQLACTITKKNFSGMTIADNAENSFTIFEDKAKYPYNHLPMSLKPTEKFNNRMELNFEKLNSKWRISTSGNKEVGRSKTINFFHASETAFFDSIYSILTGLGQALTKDSIIILETTANGYNEFEEIWTGAEQDINNFDAKFYEWWRTPEYFSYFETEEVREKFLFDTNEKISWIFERTNWLYYEKKITLEQCYWYFNKWKDIKEMIKQEYPCTPREAFIATGQCIFNVDALLKRKEQLKKNNPILARGDLKLIYTDKQERVEFIPNTNGMLTIFEFPDKKIPYVIGADVAEGKVTGDADAGQVINNLSLKQVAALHTRIDVDQYATELYKLGAYYNWGLLAVEKNFNPGTVLNLEKMNYPHLYMRQRLDDITKKISNEFGWVTSRITRPIIIADLVEYVRDYLHLIFDIDTIDEMITFVKDETGRPSAMNGKHDDRVLALAIAIKSSEQGEHSIKEAPINLGKLPKDYIEDYYNANPAQRRYLEIKWGLRKE